MSTTPSRDEVVERHPLLDAAGYPWRGNGKIMLIIGAAFAFLLNLALVGAVILGGFFARAAIVFAVGFFGSYYFDIVSSTVNGSDEAPDWPSLSSFWEDLALPFVRVVGVLLISMVPFFLTGLIPPEARKPFEFAAQAFAVGYLPMAVLGVVMFGHLGGALPHRVLPAIGRAGLGYLLMVGGLYLFRVVGAYASDVVAGIPYVGWPLGFAVLLYLLMAQARLTGLLYLQKREQIGWG